MIAIKVMVGHLRASSENRRIAEVALERRPHAARVELVDGLEHLPFYNEDIDGETGPPDRVKDFRASLGAADAILVITGEHNGTIPAVLKNAIDWGSRPYSESALWQKPVAVVGAAWGQYGGQWGQDDARKALGLAGANVVDGPRLAVSSSHERFASSHPREDLEVLTQLDAVIKRLVAEVGQVA